jgi:hypothetical protein
MIADMVVLSLGGIEIVSMLEASDQRPNWTIVCMGCCARVPDRSHSTSDSHCDPPCPAHCACLLYSSILFYLHRLPSPPERDPPIFVGPKALLPSAFSWLCYSSTIQIIRSIPSNDHGSAGLVGCCSWGGKFDACSICDGAIEALEGMRCGAIATCSTQCSRRAFVSASHSVLIRQYIQKREISVSKLRQKNERAVALVLAYNS